MKKKSLSLSLCLPVYNGEKTIQPAIQSIVDAKLINFEILISDNASNDQTKKICLRMQKKFPNLINYSQNAKNIGFAENYKKCIEKAQGKYLFFIGADDILLPKRINTLISILNHHPEIDIACSDIYTFDNDPNRIEKQFVFFGNKKKVFKKGSDALINWLFNSAVGSIGGYLVRVSEAKKYSKFIPSTSYVPQVHLTSYMAIHSSIFHCPIFSFAQRLTESPSQMANKQYLSLHIVKEILHLIDNVSKTNEESNSEKYVEVKQKMIQSYTSCLINNIISYKVFSSSFTVFNLIKLLIKLDGSIIFKPRFLIFASVSLVTPQLILRRLLFAYRRITS